MSIFALAKDLNQQGIKHTVVVTGADHALPENVCEERWNRHRKAFLNEGGSAEWADAAALQRCVEEAIQNHDYVVWPPVEKHKKDIYAIFDKFPRYQVIYLSYSSDPLFGIPGDDDGERAIQESTAHGIVLHNVN